MARPGIIWSQPTISLIAEVGDDGVVERAVPAVGFESSDFLVKKKQCT